MLHSYLKNYPVCCSDRTSAIYKASSIVKENPETFAEEAQKLFTRPAYVLFKRSFLTQAVLFERVIVLVMKVAMMDWFS
jgi:hypothetical protein